MNASSEEVEVKLPFPSAAEALARLGSVGARPRHPRSFEDNVVFDRPEPRLASSGRLLRLRDAGGRAVLTFKAPTPGERRHKVREEHETEVADPEALVRILGALGFAPVYRYQKYRTVLDVDGVEACVDETPLGCFVELEGAPDAIDRVAARLGFSPEAYVLDSYRDLQRAAHGGSEPGDLLLPPDDAGPRR